LYALSVSSTFPFFRLTGKSAFAFAPIISYFCDENNTPSIMSTPDFPLGIYKRIVLTPNLEFFMPEEESDLNVPLLGEVRAGFPSPAGDYMELRLDLNRELVRNPDATFYARVRGKSMIHAGLDEGDVLVIDRSLEPVSGKIAVCYVDGEFTVKRIRIEKDVCWLLPANDDFEPIRVTADNDFIVWGIVSYVIKKV